MALPTNGSPRDTGGAPVVEARGLTKIFKDFWGRPRVRAVDALDFEVRRGEIYGLLGPNGSGKSTTVKMMLGLLRPTSGALAVLGRSPSNVAAKARIGYLPEESYLYRYLNADETLDFYGRLFDLPDAERRRRTDQLLAMVGLDAVRHRQVGEFSKGMARRIGLAQALVNDPELVILDEPTSGLDPIGTREVKDLLKTLAARGKTIFLTSHLLADVEDVCDRVAILFAGRIRAQGAIRELLREPDRLRIELPPVPRDVLERILEQLRASAGVGEVSVGAPTRNLESFFLDVVRKAREEADAAVSRSPAMRGIAAYLAGDVPGVPAGRDRGVLDRLVRAEPETAAAAERPPPPGKPAGPDRGRLDRLAEVEGRPSGGESPPDAARDTAADSGTRRARRDVLERLSSSSPESAGDKGEAGKGD